MTEIGRQIPAAAVRGQGRVPLRLLQEPRLQRLDVREDARLLGMYSVRRLPRRLRFGSADGACSVPPAYGASPPRAARASFSRSSMRPSMKLCSAPGAASPRRATMPRGFGPRGR